MLAKTIVFSLCILTVTLPTAWGQTASKSKPPAGSKESRSSLPDIGQLLQDAENLRVAAQSMAQFGESLEHAISGISEAATVTSENLASMSSGFDPLGLQNAFKTIQQQNETIREQQVTIQSLQDAEIRRLKQENRRLRRQLRLKSSDVPKSSEDAE